MIRQPGWRNRLRYEKNVTVARSLAQSILGIEIGRQSCKAMGAADKWWPLVAGRRERGSSIIRVGHHFELRLLANPAAQPRAALTLPCGGYLRCAEGEGAGRRLTDLPQAALIVPFRPPFSTGRSSSCTAAWRCIRSGRSRSPAPAGFHSWSVGRMPPREHLPAATAHPSSRRNYYSGREDCRRSVLHGRVRGWKFQGGSPSCGISISAVIVKDLLRIFGALPNGMPGISPE